MAELLAIITAGPEAVSCVLRKKVRVSADAGCVTTITAGANAATTYKTALIFMEIPQKRKNYSKHYYLRQRACRQSFSEQSTVRDFLTTCLCTIFCVSEYEIMTGTDSDKNDTPTSGQTATVGILLLE
jgi:hypothetical protein